MTIDPDQPPTTGYSYGVPTTSGLRGEFSSATHGTALVVGEYFVSSSQPTAESNVDYLRSPFAEIRDQLNNWFSEFGSKTQLQCVESELFVAPSYTISPQFISGYEPFFRTIILYHAQLHAVDGEGSRPSDAQMNAAFLGLANLIAALVPPPAPMLLEDGTVGGYWRHGRSYASIDFEIDGEHTWVETDGKEINSGVWKLPGQSVPSQLLQNILALDS
ncbi:hypothetical protein I5589_12080 [Burkholderia vietnamiensis]|uniref:Uncharacterized protein n=1 Tax=Burkholderia vietnamiensis TaxID=60552 RepID=A0ABS1AWE5_BURVI|nr:hypothetical protein [Burkholderia vietnamiensis]MBJ9687821.1 hypothetical protein [Burkholderia vietnamiensis]